MLKSYEPVLENEVLIDAKNMRGIFNKKNVYVVGYGSLLYPYGWLRRGMRKPPKELEECIVQGYKRGPYGLISGLHFYGIVEDKQAHFNGVLARIESLHDWAGLMQTECIAGFFRYYNYRVVDITDKIEGVNLPKNAVVHCVANESKNVDLYEDYQPCPNYYESVWSSIRHKRSKKFVKEFLKTGGLNR